jgi:hypothetical protein
MASADWTTFGSTDCAMIRGMAHYTFGPTKLNGVYEYAHLLVQARNIDQPATVEIPLELYRDLLQRACAVGSPPVDKPFAPYGSDNVERRELQSKR